MIKTADGKEILEDGERLTLGVTMMDAQQRMVADAKKLPSFVGHRPGGLALTDAERQKRTALYATKDRMVADAWRDAAPSIPATPAVNLANAQPSTTKKLEPKEMATREAAIATYNERISSAWKRNATGAGNTATT